MGPTAGRSFFKCQPLDTSLCQKVIQDERRKTPCPSVQWVSPKAFGLDKIEIERREGDSADEEEAEEASPVRCPQSLAHSRRRFSGCCSLDNGRACSSLGGGGAASLNYICFDSDAVGCEGCCYCSHKPTDELVNRQP